MDLTYDLATNTITPDASEIALKWRGREPVRIHFNRSGVDELLPTGYGLALYIAKAGTLLAEVTEWATPGTAAGYYTGTLILHTSGLTSAFEDEDVSEITTDVEVQWWASGEASSPSISDSILSAKIRRPAVEPEPAAVEVLEGGEEWLEARAARWYSGITGLTGGGATKLDGITTADKSGLLATLYAFSELQDWLLVAGTDAENSANGIVRPDDYDGSTNAQVWKRVR